MTDTITLPRSVVEQALDAMNLAYEGKCRLDTIPNATDALHAALEQPQVEQETVGEAGSMPGTDGFTMACFRASDVPVGTKLYTRPQPRQPLTDAQINDHRLALPYDGEDLPDPWDFKQGARAIERAHKIGGDA